MRRAENAASSSTPTHLSTFPITHSHHMPLTHSLPLRTRAALAWPLLALLLSLAVRLPTVRGECAPGFANPPAYLNAPPGACVSCAPGRFSPIAEMNQCIDCPRGTFSSGYSATECEECEPGTYASVRAAQACAYCAPGRYQPNRASTGCIACPPGQRSSESRDSCDVCPAGTFAYAGGECRACAPGSFSSVNGSLSCSKCPYGTYQNASGQVACNACGDGTATLLVGAEDASSCQSCFDLFANYASDSSRISAVQWIQCIPHLCNHPYPLARDLCRTWTTLGVYSTESICDLRVSDPDGVFSGHTLFNSYQYDTPAELFSFMAIAGIAYVFIHTMLSLRRSTEVRNAFSRLSGCCCRCRRYSAPSGDHELAPLDVDGGAGSGGG